MSCQQAFPTADFRFNETAPTGGRPLPAITRAAIAHLYFVAIHPFEDGNGRIGRALSEKALAQCLGQPSLIALVHGIERRKKEYDSALERTNRSNEITGWLKYFAETVLDSQLWTLRWVEFLIAKGKLYARLQGMLMDLFNREIIGWSFSSNNDRHLVCQAL